MNQDQIPIDWFLTRSIATENGLEVEKARNISPVRRFLTPICDSYYCGFKPIFLAECEDLWDLAASETWLVRDGLVPLLWFFERFPLPNHLTSRLFVEEHLADHIPKAWRPFFGTYKFGRLPVEGRNTRRTKKSKLLVTGILSRSYCGLEHAQKLLNESCAAFHEEFGTATIEASLCLLQRTDPLASSQDMSLHSLQTLVALSQQFPGRLHAMSLSEFYDRIDFSEFAVIDLNEGFLCADSWMLHRAVQRGASTLGSSLRSGYSRYVNLDLVHGFGINQRIDEAEADSEKAAEVSERALASPSNHGFPWKVWGENIRQFSIHYSTASGLPIRLSDLDKHFQLLHSDLNGGIDSARISENTLVVEGWCYDSSGRAPYLNLHLGFGKETLKLRSERANRPDLSALSDAFPGATSAGFSAKIPLDELPESGKRKNSLLWLFATFEGERAQVVGAVQIWNQGHPLPSIFSIEKDLIQPEISINNQMITVSERDSISNQSRLMAKYVIQKMTGASGGKLQGNVDICRLTDQQLTLEGWAADTAEIRVAEAILLFENEKCVARIHPSLFRPDIARIYDKKLLISGFKVEHKLSLNSELKDLRLFIVWDDGAGFEISLLALNQ